MSAKFSKIIHDSCTDMANHLGCLDEKGIKDVKDKYNVALLRKGFELLMILSRDSWIRYNVDKSAEEKIQIESDIIRENVDHILRRFE